MNTKEESRTQYFKELSLRLQAEGIQSEPSDVRTLRVYQDGQPVCDVAYSGDVYRDVKYPDIPEAEELYHHTAEISGMVKEYMKVMETAPPVPAKGLDPADDFRLLADYGDCILAGQQTRLGCQFVTWSWDPRHEYVVHGHYMGGGYQAAFQGMADAHGLEKPSDLINLSFCCETVTVVQDFRDLEKIGRQHYMNLNGGCASVSEMERLDARQVAVDLLNSRGGKITPYGVIYENGIELVQHYDGKAFPEYLFENSLMAVEVSAGGSGSSWLYLPMPESQIDRMMERGGFQEHDVIRAEFAECDLPQEMMELLCIPKESIHNLNRMCAAIAELSRKGINKLTAAALMAKPETALQLTHLAESLDQFDFVPNARTPEDYGKYMIRESGHFEYDENLDEFYDYAKYGQQRTEAETGEFNDYGYISYHGILSLNELMMEDPAEAYQQEQGLQMGGIG